MSFVIKKEIKEEIQDDLVSILSFHDEDEESK
jgi:hypothetical protein